MQVTRTSLEQITENRAKEDALSQRARPGDSEMQDAMQLLMHTLKQQQSSME